MKERRIRGGGGDGKWPNNHCTGHNTPKMLLWMMNDEKTFLDGIVWIGRLSNRSSSSTNFPKRCHVPIHCSLGLDEQNKRERVCEDERGQVAARLHVWWLVAFFIPWTDI